MRRGTATRQIRGEERVRRVLLGLLLALSSALLLAAVQSPLAQARVVLDESNGEVWANWEGSASGGAITNVSIYSGDLSWSGRDPDECTGYSFPCVLRLDGSSGVLAFYFDDRTVEYAALGGASLPDPEPEPEPEPEPPRSPPNIGVNLFASFSNGTVNLTNFGAADALITRVEVADGDLDWGGTPRPDSCTGHALPAARNRVLGSPCTVTLEGTRGRVRVWSEGEIYRDVPIDLQSLQPIPIEVPDAATGPFLQVGANSTWITSNGFADLEIENIGAYAASIEGIDFVWGELSWAGRDPDECSDFGVASGGTCHLRVNMDSAGTLRFRLANGHTQDLLIGDVPMNSTGDPSQGPTMVDSPPSAVLYGPDGNQVLSGGPVALASGNFSVRAWGSDGGCGGSLNCTTPGMTGGIDSMTLLIDGRGSGTQAGCATSGCYRTDCASVLRLDQSRVCYGWWRGRFAFSNSARFEIDTRRLSEGTHTIEVLVSASPNPTKTAPLVIKVDNTPPFTAASGGLWYAGSSDRVASGSIRVMTDDSGSGVRTIDLWELLLSPPHLLLGHKERVCGPLSCLPTALNADFTVDPLALGWTDSVHHLRVETSDLATNVARMDWDVTFYRAAWLYGGLDDAIDFQRLESDLWTSSNPETIWALLRQMDKDRVLADCYGSLIRERSDPAVYYIARSARHWVQTLQPFGISGNAVRVLPDGALQSLPRLGDIVGVSESVRTNGEAAVYLLREGVRHHVTSAAVATQLGIDLNATEVVPQGFLDRTPIGSPLTWDGVAGVTYPTSWRFGGSNQHVDTTAELIRLLVAMGATTDPGRQSNWRNLAPTDRGYYEDSLTADARQARWDFGLDSSASATHSAFADPTTHQTIYRFGAPMTAPERAQIATDGPDGPTDETPIAEASQADDPPLPGEETGGAPERYNDGSAAGCDPSSDPSCQIGRALTDNNGGASPPAPPTPRASSSGASKFNRLGVVADANAHALSPRTGLFAGFELNDCTNFVSQTWHFGGGLNMTEKWFMRRISWERRYSGSWALVRDFDYYMRNTRRIAFLIRARPGAAKLSPRAELGDVVEYDWGTGHGWSHLAVIVKVDGTNTKISQHSTNRKEETWRTGWNNQTSAIARDNMRTRVIHVRLR
ncbi:amidase domain-containing protein [Conexibacter sp. JD483]|uniref:amidase domain-containing protein n=1 Tax=unclassified Conexibacter TaxID=2627773 RepID=UPI00271B8108|nr:MULTISPECIES: amidase domain-containing protein [unclassified Conexibacter]MDO8184642.1 amidase domain-containing protein [Conexibacter sp. CPCC 205706]MDO8197948.1 amidase domain-containing protein [Conexibacter sp. CPCC 205762]MDR9368378.1 amidase domain-containing protein [Conexibacter sp. JD483]